MLRFLPLLLALLAGPVFSQAFTPAEDPFTNTAPGLQRISALEAGDENKLRQQRQMIDDLAISRLGRHLNQSRTDLTILQALLDQHIIGSNDRFELQAMGVVLGDVLAGEFGLQWVNYRDDLGKSRALQIGKSSNVVFPVTMISRRAETGMEVSVNDVYNKAADIVRELMTRNQ